MGDSLPLEQELERRSKDEADAEDFWHRYNAMKSHLSAEYYRWVQANCPYYTDHGEQHIRAVIEAAGSLLNLQLNQTHNPTLLSSLDIFLILSGILWHDVGLVYSRMQHENVAKITEKIKTLGFPSPETHRIVNEISLAHTGSDGLNKPRESEDCATPNKTYTVRPKALAALVRFADEISENHSRVSSQILDKVPEKQRVFWEYANCVSASRADPARGFVRITIALQLDRAASTFDSDEFPSRAPRGKISLIEYAICRLEKMNNERAYCAREFLAYSPIRQIIANLTILKGVDRVGGYEVELTLGDFGLEPNTYPEIPLFKPFFNRNPTWDPKKIRSVTP